jgi:hypothetical protein
MCPQRHGVKQSVVETRCDLTNHADQDQRRRYLRRPNRQLPGDLGAALGRRCARAPMYLLAHAEAQARSVAPKVSACRDQSAASWLRCRATAPAIATYSFFNCSRQCRMS